MAWTDEMVEELKKLWKEGMTTGEIGKRLGVSKNSIVGKVHRLGLSGRPSPIKRKEDKVEEPVKKVAAEKVCKKVKEAKPVVAKVEPVVKPEPVVKKLPEVSESDICEIEVRSPVNGKVTVADLDNHTCRWPIGDPKDENFHFCGRKVKLGQTYCEEHAAIAYVKAGKK